MLKNFLLTWPPVSKILGGLVESKTYTFLITSNREGKTRTLTVRSSWLKAFAALSIIFAVLIAAAGVDYFGLLLSQSQSKRLQAENAQLTREFSVVKGKLATLENSLDQIQTLTTKIKLITDVGDNDRVMNLSIPQVPRFHQNMALYENHVSGVDATRVPASIAQPFQQDATFLQRPVLDVIDGELAATPNDKYANLSIRIDRAVQQSRLEEQGVIRLQELLQERQSILNSTPTIMPVHGFFSSPFGYRPDPFVPGGLDFHPGVDIAAPIGTPVHATANGVVSFIGYDAGYGKLVEIDNGYGVQTLFGHNSQIYVQVGQKVTRGEVISAVGDTGRSTGPHSHYEIRVDGVPVNPMQYILNPP